MTDLTQLINKYQGYLDHVKNNVRGGDVYLLELIINDLKNLMK